MRMLSRCMNCFLRLPAFALLTLTAAAGGFCSTATAAEEKAAVSPALAAFEKTLQTLGAEAKAAEAVMMGKDSKGFGPLVALLEKTCGVSTEGLPADLQAAFAAFTEGAKARLIILKTLPQNVPLPGLPAWMEATEKDNPQAVQAVRDFPARLKEVDANGKALQRQLEKTAAAHGIDLRPFCDPDSIGRKTFAPAQGETTPEQFATAIRGYVTARSEMSAKAKARTNGSSMQNGAEMLTEQCRILYTIPTGGLPAALTDAFLDYRSALEKVAWNASDFPADMPGDRTALAAYFEKKSAEDPGFEARLNQLAAQQKKRALETGEASQNLMKVAAEMKLDLGELVKGRPAAPAKQP